MSNQPRDLNFKDLPLQLHEANVSPGARYWRIRKVRVLDPHEGGGMHHIFVRCFRDGQRVTNIPVRHFWPGGEVKGRTEGKPLNEWGDWNAGLFGDWKVENGPGPYGVEIDGASDSLTGMGLPRKQHFSYVVEFEEVEAQANGGSPDPDPTPPDPPGASLEEALRNALRDQGQSLLAAIYRDNFAPVSGTVTVTHDNRRYRACRAQRIGGSDGRIYFHKEGEAQVRHISL